jgi:hypothetical protein
MNQQRPLPDWLSTPGDHDLPSGRAVIIEPIEETWICLDLGGRLVAVIDLDEEPPLVRLSLQWARDRRLTPPGTRPYHCNATVALVDGGLVVRDLPAGIHTSMRRVLLDPGSLAVCDLVGRRRTRFLSRRPGGTPP